MQTGANFHPFAIGRAQRIAGAELLDHPAYHLGQRRLWHPAGGRMKAEHPHLGAIRKQHRS
jgi:hypothetical protein